MDERIDGEIDRQTHTHTRTYRYILFLFVHHPTNLVNFCISEFTCTYVHTYVNRYMCNAHVHVFLSNTCTYIHVYAHVHVFYLIRVKFCVLAAEARSRFL